MPWDDLHDPKGPPGGSGGGPKKNPSGGPQMEIPQIKIPNLKPSTFLGAVLVLLAVWLIPGVFYTVQPDEEGIVTRFGKYVRSTDPGLHYKLPSPFEHVNTPKVKKVRRIEVGFRILNSGPPQKVRDVPVESLMLTGDQNIVDIDLVVQYQIRNAVEYLFNIETRQKLIRNVAETAIRGIVGSKNIDEALTTGKSEIQVLAKIQIQSLLDKYKAGVQIVTTQLQDVHPPTQVAASFKDVVSAREDKERMINQAQGYRKAVIPETRGKSAQIVRQAEGYKEEKIQRAQGDTQGFLALYEEYKKAPEITRKRIYLETMEEILPDMKKVVVSSSTGNVLPILPLGQTPAVLQGK
jgi:modulator of FtsH protease HflK